MRNECAIYFIINKDSCLLAGDGKREFFDGA